MAKETPKFKTYADILWDIHNDHGCSMHLKYFTDKCEKNEQMDKFILKLKSFNSKTNWFRVEDVRNILTELNKK